MSQIDHQSPNPSQSFSLSKFNLPIELNMNHSHSQSSFFGTSCKLALGVGISLLAASASQASVMHFQLRAVSQTADGTIQTSTGVIINGGDATLSAAIAPGAKIVFELDVVFEGGNLTGKIGIAQGAIVSTTSSGRFLTAGAGGIVGRNIANFNNTGAAPGLATADLSAQYPYTGGAVNVAPTAGGTADGILDAGTTIAGGSSSTNWFAAVGPVGSSFGNGTSTLPIGEFVLTLGAGSDILTGGTTNIGYFLRSSVGGTATIKNYNTGQLDAANFSYNYQGNIALATAGTQTTVNAYGAMISAGVTVIAVPEPSAFGMLALGALGLVGFRRLGLRRTA